MDACMKLTKEQLQNILRAARKPVSGNKPELCQRILANGLSLGGASRSIVSPPAPVPKISPYIPPLRAAVPSVPPPRSPVLTTVRPASPPMAKPMSPLPTVRPMSPPRPASPPTVSSQWSLTPNAPRTLSSLLDEIGTFEDTLALRNRLMEIVQAYRPLPPYVPVPLRGTPFATLQTFVRQDHPMVIDLVNVFNHDDTDEFEAFLDNQRMSLDAFLNSGFFTVPVNIEIRPNDILRIDDYRDNGLYYVYDDNGTLMVVATPGNYMLPSEALGMLEQYNVQNQEDFANIYEVDPYVLDLFGIKLNGEDLNFASEDNGQIGEPGVYSPAPAHA